LTLSAPAKVDAAIALRANGVKKAVKRGKTKRTTCAPAATRRRRGQRPCTRLVAKGTLHLGALRAGTTKVSITGKLAGHALARGAYQLTLRVVGGRATKVLRFTIKAAARRR
jgi:hypothetical protein